MQLFWWLNLYTIKSLGFNSHRTQFLSIATSKWLLLFFIIVLDHILIQITGLESSNSDFLVRLSLSQCIAFFPLIRSVCQKEQSTYE